MAKAHKYNFHFESVNFSKIANLKKNLGPPKERPNKIGFMHHYKLFMYSEKQLGLLRLGYIGKTFFLR